MQFPLKFIEKLPLTSPISFEHTYLKVTFPLQAERCFQSNAEFTSEHHDSAPLYQQITVFHGDHAPLTVFARAHKSKHSAEEACHLAGSDKQVMFCLQPT